MTLLQRKQLDWINAGWVGIAAFEATGGSGVITTEITAALGTAGRGGTAVPVQISASEGEGVIATGDHNRVEIYDSATKEKLVDGSGNEVYGRITESGGAYTLTYYVLDAGAQTAHSISPATDIDLYFPYRFTADKYPVDAAIALTLKNVYSEPTPGNGGANPEIAEPIAVTAADTLDDLSTTPATGSAMKLSVNGQVFASTEPSPAFSRSGLALTWSAANAGFSLQTTDNVVAYYFAS
ncbi:hypothetical protein H6G45_09165 [Synechocystis sp. FACHB-383]|uniref:hypothetical protein n=1 Tax=Synechocystis sp. FACHB-383 TaxID=2692864 RepID=UPI0016876DC4|nr:hypothetical protein [Synechocystis sp. FACHB-383]MBD2653655.1 hypothetical protein [Synechocystis sp. FACHB-383]